MDSDELVERLGAKTRILSFREQIRRSPNPHRWAALAVLLVGAVLTPLDFFIVNVALPSIQQGLGVSDGAVQFVMSGYAGAFAVLLVTGGRLGDLYGRRRMFMTGMVGFALASVFCGTAWSPGVLVLGRILQGVASAMLAPQVIASIHVLFPPEEKVRALGIYGATFGLAGIIGQILSGTLIRADILGLGWRAIFLINVPIVAIALLGTAWLVKESRAEDNRKSRLDLAGAALLLVALVALVYPLIEGRQEGWPRWTFISLVLCPVILALFWQVEKFVARRGGAPLIHPRLFHAPGFTRGLGITLLFYMVSAFFMTFPIYLQAGLHYSPFQVGIGVLPVGCGFFVGPLTTPGATRVLGARVPVLGLLVGATSLTLLSFAVNSTGLAHTLLFIPSLFGIGFGQGFVMPTMVRTVIQGVEPDYAGAASGVVTSTLQISASLGVATVGGVFFAVLKARTNDPVAITHAFTVSMLFLAVLLVCAALLAFGLSVKTKAAEPARAPA